MNKSKSPVLMSLGEVLGDFLIGMSVTGALYFVFLIGGHSAPLGAAYGIGAWIFCIFTLVHCLLTDGGAILMVGMLLGCIGIAVGVVCFIVWLFMGLLA